MSEMPKSISRETKMIHIRMPVSLIRRIDAYAIRRKESKTQLIVDAVSDYLRRESALENFRKLKGVLKPEDAPEWASYKTGAEWVERLRAKERDNSEWPIL